MAGQPNTAGISRRVALSALLALIGPLWSVSFGQMPPEGPMLGPEGRPMYAAGPNMPVYVPGPNMPMPAGPSTPMYAPGPNMPMPAGAPNMPIPGPGPAMSPLGPPQPGGTPPATPPEEIVVQVRVEGNRTVGLEKIIPRIRTRVGRAYDEWQVQEDVRDLYKMGVFAYVHSLRQPVQGGVVVIFQVAERPLLQGSLASSATTPIGPMSSEKRPNSRWAMRPIPSPWNNGRRRLWNTTEERAIAKVRVSVLEGDKVGDLRVVYVVNEGPRKKCLWVNFVGNTFRQHRQAEDDHRLASALVLSVFRRGRPQADRRGREQTDRLLSRLRLLLMPRRPRIGINENQDWVTITFVINEGQAIPVRNISFLGNKKFDTSRLAAKLKLLGGQSFDQNQQNLDLAKAPRRVRRRGLRLCQGRGRQPPCG